MSSSIFDTSAAATYLTDATSIPLYSRVVFTDASGLKVKVAGATEHADGVTGTPVDNGSVVVYLLGGGGTAYGIAGSAITVGAPLFAAADGALAATGTLQEGIALQARASGDITEWRSKPLPAVTGGGD